MFFASILPATEESRYAIKRGSVLFIGSWVFGDTLKNDNRHHPALSDFQKQILPTGWRPYCTDMHIGSRIREVLMHLSREHTVTWLAEQLNCHRVNVYNIFNRGTIDTELLRRISIVLGHDFFQDLSDDLHNQGFEKHTDKG